MKFTPLVLALGLAAASLTKDEQRQAKREQKAKHNAAKQAARQKKWHARHGPVVRSMLRTTVTWPQCEIGQCNEAGKCINTVKDYHKCNKVLNKAVFAEKKRLAKIEKQRAKRRAGLRKLNGRLRRIKSSSVNETCLFVPDRNPYGYIGNVTFATEAITAYNLSDKDGEDLPVTDYAGTWTIEKPEDAPYAGKWYILAQPVGAYFSEVHVNDVSNQITAGHREDQIMSDTLNLFQKHIRIIGFPDWCDGATTKSYSGDMLVSRTRVDFPLRTSSGHPDSFRFYYCYDHSARDMSCE